MASRGTTPKATRRSTRSQSRDVSGSPTNTRASRRARSAEVEGGLDNDSNNARTARRPHKGKKKATGAAKLPVLEEDPDAAEEDQDGLQDEIAAAVQQSPGAVSNVSGTTAVTQTTAIGGTDQDFDEVTYELPLLYDTADGLLKILAPENATANDLGAIVEDLKVPGSKIGLQLKKREAAFTTHYGALTDSQYLDPPVFLRNSMKRKSMTKLDTSPWRPDDILFKANATNLARRLVVLERGSAETYRFIRELDNMFPALFVNSFGGFQSGELPIGGSNILRQTLELALEVRTQTLIMTLGNVKEEDTFDPDVTLNQVFFTGSDPSQSQQELRGWNFDQMGIATPIQEDPEKGLLERIQRIRNHFPDNGDLVDWDALEADFPWSAFQVLVLDWVRMRNRELSNMVDGRGGPGKVVQLLEAQYQGITIEEPFSTAAGMGQPQFTPSRQNLQVRAQTQPTPPEKRKPANMSGGIMRDSADVALLKAIDKRLSGGSFTNTAPAVLPVQQSDNAALAEEPLHEEDTWQPPPDVYEDPVSAIPDPPPASEYRPEWEPLLQAAATQDMRNREAFRRQQHQPPRRFIDPQVNAQRVEFGDDFSQTPEAMPSSSRNRLGKRPMRDDDEDALDPSQDVGFQTDDRNIDPAARRLAAPVPRAQLTAPTARMTATQSPRKRARFSANVEEEYLDDADRDAEADPDDDGEQADAAGNYQRTKALAKMRSRQASQEGVLARPTGSQPQGGQGARNPGKRRWTVEQEELLIRYIEHHGPKWSEIKKVDDNAGDQGLLQQWSQVDLKDKAINMHVDFRKAGTPLPQNFEQITLRRRDRERLESMGILV